MMSLYRAAGDGQAKTCAFAFRLGGEEGFPDLCKNGWGDPRSRVNQVDADAAYSAFRLGAPDPHNYRPALRHRVAGVRQQVQKDLAQLLAIRLNVRQRLGEVSHDFNLLSPKMIFNKFKRILDFLADIQNRHFLLTVVVKPEETSDQLAHAVDLVGYDFQCMRLSRIIRKLSCQ